MISFDNSTLKLFIDENIEFLTGARIQKIQQPTRREFLFSLRNNNETQKMFIDINPQTFHICFINKENEAKRLIEIPQKPPMFCMLLRKYLENSKIAKVIQPKFERIIEFYIETYNELSEKIYLCLTVELMGKHSNVILYNYDTNIIIGCAHNVGAEKSKIRELQGGLPYVYPPKQTQEWFKSPFKSNEEIDNYYTEIIANDKFNKLKTKYLLFVNKKLKKLETSLTKMENQLISCEKTDNYRLLGDLIMANLYNNKNYVENILVYDYENDKNITINLDKTKTLKENANKYYKLYNKSKTSNQKLTEFINKANEDKLYLEQLLYSIENSNTINDLTELSSEIEPDKKNTDKVKVSKPIEIKENDSTIWIGKNNKQNDYIVSKLAKDDDLWFHVHNIAGSHVLLRSNNINDDLILKCAKLAKQYSSASASSKIGVIYTKAKYLKKPPKSNLGYVTYSNETEIIID